MSFSDLASGNWYFKVEFVNLTKQKIEDIENRNLKINETEFTIDFFTDLGVHGSDRHFSGKKLSNKKIA